MSQEKINNRKKTKGDLLHATKKRLMRITVIIAGVLVAAGVFACIVSYNKGYDVGEKDGEITGRYLQQLSDSLSTTAADETTASTDETTASTDETTASTDETTASSDTETTAN